MKAILPPVDKKMLLAELTDDKFVRNTNYAHNQLFIFKAKDSPNLMLEVGRLREWSFRSAGGGTGNECDIDEYDIAEDGYQQLIVWDPKHEEIIGGYRFYVPLENESGEAIAKKLVTSHLFNFSDRFKSEYLPHMIELGRSFVQPVYQSTHRARKGIFALDNLWDGLGTLIIEHPNMKYFFGKVTMYPHFDREARNMILYFLRKHFPDPEQLVIPTKPLEINVNSEEMDRYFSAGSYKDNYKLLVKGVREHNENLPPLINAYMNLSPTMKVFGTVITEDFGNVEETGIMITIKDIYLPKVERHILTYKRYIDTYKRWRYYLRKDKFSAQG